MKILLIDDTTENLIAGKKAIEEIFADSTVDTCDNFTDAMKLIIPDSGYDAVLTDLNMPVVECTGWGSFLRGAFKSDEIIPYGFIIALRAALMGAKHVAIVTDGGHHSSAINAAIEYLGMGNGNSKMNHVKPHSALMVAEDETKSNFTINRAKFVIVDSPKGGSSPRRGFQGALKILLRA